MSSRHKSFFERTSHPYYIASPAFRQTSGGVRALHYFCHALNEAGYEAYIATDLGGTNPYLRTPELTQDIVKRHKASGCVPIGVYPEVAHGNMLGLPVVARWILNKPGHLGGGTSYGKDEILFYWDEWMIDSSIAADKLNIPIIDLRIFNDRDAPPKRKGFCYYANKYFRTGRDISPSLIQNGTSLCLRIPRSPQEIAGILRASETFYCYEPSSLVLEALACGCPVAMIDTPYLDEFKWEKNPIFRVKESDIGKIKPPEVDSVRITEYFQRIDTQAWLQIENFIEKTQNAARIQAERQRAPEYQRQEADSAFHNTEIEPASNSLAPLLAPLAPPTHHQLKSENYHLWLTHRGQILQKYATSFPDTSATDNISFHLVIELPDGRMHAFADTLDTLAAQIHPSWTLDIFSVLQKPEGLDSISCIEWHQIQPSCDVRSEIKSRISSLSYNWIIELIPGVKLDPLYLWRLALTATEQPDCQAIFVDDDIYNEETGTRSLPRFKPGTNPELLTNSDLAGILAVRREAWNESALTSSRPWHDQLYHTIENFGHDAIKHIPDVLLSYRDAIPHDDIGHRAALARFLQAQGRDGELLGTGLHSWCIRYPLAAPPNVTIAVTYRGKIILEHITRCLSSLFKYSRYPNFEVLVCTAEKQFDPKLLTLIEQLSGESGKTIKHMSADGVEGLPALINTIAQSSTSEFLLLIDESVQIIQESWLEELVRQSQQPNIAAAAPRMIQPGTAKLEYAGEILGFKGIFGTPYREEVSYQDQTTLKPLWTETPHDLSILPASCFLVRRSSFNAVGGLDTAEMASHLGTQDLGLKLRARGERLIYQPLANIVYQNSNETSLPESPEKIARTILNKSSAKTRFTQKWFSKNASDTYWNKNLSLVESNPVPETEYLADWQIVPGETPRILARPVTNGQGYFRITAPLNAAQQQGLVQECIWYQGSNNHHFTPEEILRLAPQSLIVQNYMNNGAIQSLASLHSTPGRPFTIFTVDDLMDDLVDSNPLKCTIAPNPRERIKFALSRCDRLVVSTEYLGEAYRHMIRDIQIVPNRLEQSLWLPLLSKKRTGIKPRIGWAGGTTHLDDLRLLKEIIEATREEADWIFMGMCPDEIRPLVHEFHPFVSLLDYPAYLASLNFDIAVAPLAEIPFNRAKSNLRLLEYGVLGIPVVCTDIDPYRNSPARLVPNITAAWIEALRERIYDADAREQEGRAMRQWVLQHFLLENHLEEWLLAHLP